MAGKDETEPWYWQDESFKLDSESPLAISRSFWEELAHSEDDSQLLFPPAPVPDARIQDSNPSSYPYTLDDSQGSDSHASSFVEYCGQPGDRFKRRRMLKFSGARIDGLVADALPYGSVFGAPSAVHATYENCTSPVIPGSEEEYMLPVSSASSSLWITRNDDATTSVPTNVQQPADKWMLRCFEEKEAYSTSEQIKLHVLPFNEHNTGMPTGSFLRPWQPQHMEPSQLSKRPQHPQLSQQSQPTQSSEEPDLLQGPLTPFSKPPIPGRRFSTGPSRFKGKSSTPVAFPFALLKPSAAQGDVTLNDINQRLLSPPPRSTPRPFPTDDEKPSTPSGAGLSGKSVVACTKIHTEGNGTITIMRTRG